MRLAAGKEIADVSQALLGSKAKMSRIENGKQVVRVADVAAWCEFYGADARTTASLKLMAPGTRQDDWWESTTIGAIQGWFTIYAGLEVIACRIRCHEPLLVPGLLQTEAYARAVISAEPGVSPTVVEQRVRFRMERQQRSLEGITFVVGEAALKFVVGSPEIMAEQIAHLRASAADIRILPFTAGPTLPTGYWAMLEFDDPEDPPVVYVEGAGIARYLDKPKDWAKYEAAWKMVMSRAVPIGEWTG